MVAAWREDGARSVYCTEEEAMGPSHTRLGASASALGAGSKETVQSEAPEGWKVLLWAPAGNRPWSWSRGGERAHGKSPG